jgi:formamidopyrimidine-DNA glycosylase
LPVPELPEVETVRRTLAPALEGRRVTRAVLHRSDYCERAGGKPCRPKDLLQGATIRSVERHGKQLAFVSLEGPVLVAHLGMSGQLRIIDPAARPAPATHLHAEWVLDSGARLRFRDPRRFGGLWALPSEDDLRQRWATLGPDGLTATAAELRSRAAESRRAIKAVLLDQEVIAGVGNIYADEALFLSRINPARPARLLQPAEWEALTEAIHRTLAAAIEARGSTLRDYIDALGVAGSAQAAHAVYGRAGDPCLVCGRRLKGSRLAGRATVHCSQCQPKRVSRTVKKS